MRLHRTLMILIVVVLGLSGCASFNTPIYSPNYETIDRVKRKNLQKMSVGEVQPSNPSAAVNRITLRGASLAPPNGTYSKYLEEAIRSDLTEMGFYDPLSTTRIDITILKNDINVAGIVTGYGVLEINLKISKRGASVLEKPYAARTEFESSFAAATAVPKGQSEYPNLVKTLLQKVYTDPAFQEVVKND